MGVVPVSCLALRRTRTIIHTIPNNDQAASAAEEIRSSPEFEHRWVLDAGNVAQARAHLQVVRGEEEQPDSGVTVRVTIPASARAADLEARLRALQGTPEPPDAP